MCVVCVGVCEHAYVCVFCVTLVSRLSPPPEINAQKWRAGALYVHSPGYRRNVDRTLMTVGRSGENHSHSHACVA